MTLTLSVGWQCKDCVFRGKWPLQALLERLGLVGASPAVEPSRAPPRGPA
ncbi:MAG TPA: hypothetical protein VJB16_03810 [archaeon]|nr:hypothetical protein [archaeon]